jgi:hypothetical protein
VGPESTQHPGVALLCSRNRRILSPIRDDCRTADHLNNGQSIDLFFEARSQERLEAFWNEICARRAAFDWELDVRTADTSVTMNCAGALIGNMVLLVAIPCSYEQSTKAYEDLMRINNERMTELRDALKDRERLARELEALKDKHR